MKKYRHIPRPESHKKSRDVLPERLYNCPLHPFNLKSKIGLVDGGKPPRQHCNQEIDNSPEDWGACHQCTAGLRNETQHFDKCWVSLTFNPTYLKGICRLDMLPKIVTPTAPHPLKKWNWRIFDVSLVSNIHFGWDKEFLSPLLDNACAIF